MMMMMMMMTGAARVMPRTTAGVCGSTGAKREYKICYSKGCINLAGKEGVYMMAWRERGRDAAVKDARTNAGKNGKQAMQQYRMHE